MAAETTIVFMLSSVLSSLRVTPRSPNFTILFLLVKNTFCGWVDTFGQQAEAFPLAMHFRVRACTQRQNRSDCCITLKYMHMISAAEAINVRTHLDVTVCQLSIVQIFHCEAHLDKPVHHLRLVELPLFLRSLCMGVVGVDVSERNQALTKSILVASECDQSACWQVSFGCDRGDADFEVARVAVLENQQQIFSASCGHQRGGRNVEAQDRAMDFKRPESLTSLNSACMTRAHPLYPLTPSTHPPFVPTHPSTK